MTHPADISPTTLEGILARLRAKPQLWSRYIDQEASGDELFGLWLFMVDARLHVTCGITHSDVPDQLWREEYDAGTDPAGYADGLSLIYARWGQHWPAPPPTPDQHPAERHHPWN